MEKTPECEYKEFYCFPHGKCFLRDQFEIFSDTGGFNDPNLSNVGGPFHNEEEFTRRTRDILTQTGKLNCPYGHEIADLIDRIIKGKRKLGQLI